MTPNVVAEHRITAVAPFEMPSVLTDHVESRSWHRLSTTRRCDSRIAADHRIELPGLQNKIHGYASGLEKSESSPWRRPGCKSTVLSCRVVRVATTPPGCSAWVRCTAADFGRDSCTEPRSIALISSIFRSPEFFDPTGKGPFLPRPVAASVGNSNLLIKTLR